MYWVYYYNEYVLLYTIKGGREQPLKTLTTYSTDSEQCMFILYIKTKQTKRFYQYDT